MLLDIDSLKNNVILLLDTFFYIVIWKGETIVKWEDAGYHNDPNYENFKNLLAQPIEDSKVISSINRSNWSIVHNGREIPIA